MRCVDFASYLSSTNSGDREFHLPEQHTLHIRMPTTALYGAHLEQQELSDDIKSEIQNVGDWLLTPAGAARFVRRTDRRQTYTVDTIKDKKVTPLLEKLGFAQAVSTMYSSILQELISNDNAVSSCGMPHISHYRPQLSPKLERSCFHHAHNNFWGSAHCRGKETRSRIHHLHNSRCSH